jgi:hypothetical protein
MKKNNLASNTLIKSATRGHHDLYGAQLIKNSETNFLIEEVGKSGGGSI